MTKGALPGDYIPAVGNYMLPGNWEYPELGLYPIPYIPG